MRNLLIFSGFMFATFFLLKCSIDSASAEITPFPLPEFTEEDPDKWINSEPRTIEELIGNVLLVDIWTFACWNCYRSFPWMNQLEANLKDKPFKVIGIHTPEFDYEKVRTSVEKKAKEFRLKHPIMMDNEFKYWQKLNNQYWPTYYLVDKNGIVRYKFIGETHANTRKSARIEAAIQTLLSE